MNKWGFAWLAVLPYLVGAGLFLLGAARFLAHGDQIGTLIFGIAGTLAILISCVNYSHRNAN